MVCFINFSSVIKSKGIWFKCQQCNQHVDVIYHLDCGNLCRISNINYYSKKILFKVETYVWCSELLSKVSYDDDNDDTALWQLLLRKYPTLIRGDFLYVKGKNVTLDTLLHFFTLSKENLICGSINDTCFRSTKTILQFIESIK